MADTANASVPIVRWLPDETFFSVCCRQHRFMCQVTKASTTAWLFGEGSRSIQHDFPSKLNSLPQKAKEVWGSPFNIITEHTILPLFFPFQSKERIEDIFDTVSNNSLGTLKYRLGLVTGRFGAEHPLKACLECLREDRIKHGVAYWHLSHQYPGVTLCPKHGTLVGICSANRQWSDSAHWVLPAEDLIASVAEQPVCPTVVQILKRLGHSVIELAKLGISVQFRPEDVTAAYNEAIRHLSVNTEACFDAEADLASFASQLQPYLPLASLPTTPQKAKTFIQSLIRTPRVNSHPLKHLIMITYIFGEFGPFLGALNRFQSAGDQDKHSPDHGRRAVDDKPANQFKSQEIRDRVFKKLKPKKLKPELRDQILGCLRNGVEKNSIAERYGVSVSTINRILRADPHMMAAWTTQRRNLSLHDHRAAWVSAIGMNPNASPKILRLMLPKVYQWLYRNDNVWLMAQTKRMPSGRVGNNQKIDWSARDRQLCESIELSIQRWKTSATNLPVRADHIFALVPTLHRCLEKRNRYPEARKLLESVTQSTKT
ncbi:TnsD family Tn7-like transposition protein [Pseudomonas putida]|uniref:TnsD family Tn7-like transposition protein n=1 Tax=Pseudomonas putida TaxID=303 RepID=UPI00226DF496|nr:TnsD family Tn7-like transposition protein [Pseudomonas putida]WAB98060.1 TnsD family Tn7-like transposition protein [Pseudomonas putida]